MHVTMVMQFSDSKRGMGGPSTLIQCCFYTACSVRKAHLHICDFVWSLERLSTLPAFIIAGQRRCRETRWILLTLHLPFYFFFTLCGCSVWPHRTSTLLEDNPINSPAPYSLHSRRSLCDEIIAAANHLFENDVTSEDSRSGIQRSLSIVKFSFSGVCVCKCVCVYYTSL